jgi:DNA-binding winged helix-turn-helix (wHTH) protein
VRRPLDCVACRGDTGALVGGPYRGLINGLSSASGDRALSMTVRFGEFELDEAGRSLRLAGMPVELQPKVFDLLAYLVRNAGRVVPKDELLDQLWPNVHVTEASLQRAVSLLRTTLRQGHLEGALKSYVRHGYRFGIDSGDLRPLMPNASAANADLHAARGAIAERQWAKAVDVFAKSAASDLGADDYELWGFAVECLGRPGDALAPLGIAVERNEAQGNAQRAAHCCVTIAKIHLERAQTAISRGWLARASSLLKDSGPTETLAYLQWMQARFAAFEGRPEDALTIAEQALVAAEASGSRRLQALTRVYRGFFAISLGRTREGLEHQDHAAALALSSEVDPITGSLIYCNILWSCRSLADWSRASQWCDGFEAWCEANYAHVSPSCQLHRSEVLGIKSTLGEAHDRINGALAGLPDTDPWALGDAYRVRGDISASRGDLEGARNDYAKAYSVGWDAEPGNAILLHDDGDTEGAITALDRVLASVGWFGLQRRGWILANKARICALSGREDEARACLKKIADNYDEWPSASIRAVALEAQANLPHHGGEEPTAIQQLHLARQLWTSIEGEYHAARVRLDLARALINADDRAGARVELQCALTVVERIGARGLERDITDLLATLGTRVTAT